MTGSGGGEVWKEGRSTLDLVRRIYRKAAREGLSIRSRMVSLRYPKVAAAWRRGPAVRAIFWLMKRTIEDSGCAACILC